MISYIANIVGSYVFLGTIYIVLGFTLLIHAYTVSAKRGTDSTQRDTALKVDIKADAELPF